ncbi:hypothetical protein [Jannaschia sp. 2305UL9-9]|uniref:hypothetical protein n=1 Tax=Jannaschia sp. 2305UL9-9 TaxID=3121638 RepID=UPI003526DDA4
MVDEHKIETWLAEMADDTVPLGDDLRARLIADAPVPPAPQAWWRTLGVGLWGGALGVPLAAVCGVWLGIAQPALVLQSVPGLSQATEEVASDGLLDDVYGTSWEEWL